MKYLVTGGAGFIGSNLVDELIRRGDEVVVIDNLSTGKKEYINSKAKFYKVDICSEKIAEIFAREKFDYIFHLAAQVDVRKSVDDAMLDNKVNAAGSFNIFKNSYLNKAKKVIFISTGGALYGDCVRPATEEDLIKPISPYAIHKYTAERYLEFFHDVYGLNYIILRLANIYGPRQYKGGEGAVVATFTHNAINNNESAVYGDGLQTRDFVYAGDAVDACLLSARSDYKGVVNIGVGIETSILDLIRIIEKIVGHAFKFAYKKERAGEARKSVLDNKKAKEVLGWEPKVNLEEGIKKTIEWLRLVKS